MTFSPFSRSAGGGGLAKLLYTPSSFRVIASGDHVLCARTGVPIALDALRYWSVDAQQAYASAQIAVEAMTGRTPAAPAPADDAG